MTSTKQKPPKTLAVWLQALRAFSFTASMIPVLLAATLAAEKPNVRWNLLPLVVLGVLFLHAGANLVSDAADYKRGVDRPGTFGGSGVLINGWLSEREVFFAGIILLATGSIIGFILTALCGMPVLWLGIAGVLGGFGYGARPFGFKYIALGDLTIFILFGLLISFGSYYVLTGFLDTHVLLISLPLAFLVTAIVSSNNMRDISNDAKAGIRTVATTIGPKFSRLEYYLLVAGTYLSGFLLVLCRALPLYSLLFLLSAPLAIKNIITVKNSTKSGNTNIAKIDVETAQLHLIFGALMIIGILVELSL